MHGSLPGRLPCIRCPLRRAMGRRIKTQVHMKHFLTGAVLWLASWALFPAGAGAQAFVHPGINQTPQDLAYLKRLIAENQEPWKSAYHRLLEKADTTFEPKAFAHVLRGPYGRPNIGGEELARSAQMAYDCALAWYLSGDRHYANTAIRILNAWSGTLWDFDYNDAKLLAGLTAHVFCNAAEILRYTGAGWQKKDIDRFTGMLMTVYYPLLRYYFPTANGNWDGAICHSLLAIAIFTDNRGLFNRTIDHLLHGPVNGSIFKYIYPNGECEESPRDQGHVQLGLGQFAGAAEVAFSQGVDLFSIGDDRIARGFEYSAGYLLGHTPYCYCEISPRAMRLSDIYQYVYRHYAAEGLDLPFVAQAADSTLARASTSVLSAVRASFAGKPKPHRQLAADQLAYIAGADRNPPAPPRDAILVAPGEPVQPALDSAAGTGRWVVLEKGVHKIPTALKLPSGVTLAGEGSASVLFLDPASGERDAVVNATDDLHDVTLRNFLIEGAPFTETPTDPNSARSFQNKWNRGGILLRAGQVNRMHDLHFVNLTVRHCTYNGISISGARNLEFSGCNLNENGAGVVPGPKLQHNLLITHSAHISITGSRLDTSPDGSGIALGDCDSATITGNELARNGLDGITLSECREVAIRDNLLEGNNENGIRAERLHAGSEKVQVASNQIRFNGTHALEASGVRPLSISGNSCEGNGPFTGQILKTGQMEIDGKQSF